MDVIEVLRRLVLPERTYADFPRDYEEGKCYWCGGGWEQVPGPRGGKGELTQTGAHEPDCPYQAAIDFLGH